MHPCRFAGNQYTPYVRVAVFADVRVAVFACVRVAVFADVRVAVFADVRVAVFAGVRVAGVSCILVLPVENQYRIASKYLKDVQNFKSLSRPFKS